MLEQQSGPTPITPGSPDTSPVPALAPNHLYIVILFAYRTTDMKADVIVVPKMACNDADAYDGIDQLNLQAHPLGEDWAGHMVQATLVPDELVVQAHAQMAGSPAPVRAPWEMAPTPHVLDTDLTSGGLHVTGPSLPPGVDLPKVPPIPRKKDLVLAWPTDAKLFGPIF